MIGVVKMFEKDGSVTKIGEFGLSEFFNFSLAKNYEETELFVKVEFNLIRVYLDINELKSSKTETFIEP